MKRMSFFLTSRKLGMLGLINLFFFFFGSNISFFVIVLISLTFLFFHRKDLSLISERQLSPTSLIYSPVNGIIASITRQSIFIQISPFNECGIYAPFKCETREFTKGFHPEILIANDKENEIRLRFIKKKIEKKPRFWLETKDRAKCGALIGFKLFGGQLEVELKGDVKIIAKVGDRVMASQTIIGQFKELNDK